MTTTPLPPQPGPTNPDPAPSPDPSPAPQPPPGEPQPGPMSEHIHIRFSKAENESVTDENFKARGRLDRNRSLDARSFGGRRTGLVKDEAELARLAALDRRLLALARRAIDKNG